jgi:[acyl-carrier-protein] S-malonyltransferase
MEVFVMKIGMLFPGYPQQFVGMGKELYDNSRTIQEYFEEASNCLGTNFVKLCFASSDAELSKISNAYTSLFLVGVSTAAMIQELCPTITLSAVAGYGVGEYSALHIARVLTLPDGLYLLNKLSQFYTTIREELDIKTVIVNGLNAKKLNQLCEEISSPELCAHISVYENKNEHQVSGHSDAVNAVADSASDAGADKVKEVDSIEGYHTPLLNDLAEQLKIYLTKVDFKEPQIPIITGINGKEVCRAKKAQDAIIRQIVEPLHWNNVLKQFAETDIIIVPAPSKMLVAELKAYYPSKIVMGVDTLADLQALQELIRENEPVSIPEGMQEVQEL